MSSGSSKIVALSFVGLLAAGAGAWSVIGSAGKKDAALAGPAVPDEFSVEKMKAASNENPGEMFEKMRGTMDRTDLNEEQRQQIRDNARSVMEERIQAGADEWMKAGADEKDAVLDRQIDEFEKFRKMREERDKAREEEQQAKEGVEKSEEDREKEREKRMEGWRKREAGKSQAQRKKDSESRNPNQMAQRMAYSSAMQKRMQARGIQPPRWGGPGGPGGGGRGPRP